MRMIRKYAGWRIAGCMFLLPGVMAMAQKRLPIGGTTVPPMSGTTDGLGGTLPNASDSGRGPTSAGLGLSLPDDSGDSSVSRNLSAIRSHLANVERHKALSLETEQLLRMTAELQVKISSNAPGLKQEEMLRQISTIERLAKDVKERMKGGR